LESKLKQLARLDAANPKAHRSRSSEINDEFHLTIYEAAQRPRLARLIAELRASSRAYIAIFPKLVDRLAEAEHEHDMVFEACLARNPRQAAQAMVTHLQHTVDVVAASIGDGDSRQ
jgi:DNA-binding GntR family transcriptional regulator